jgi:hypothetical protein
MVLCTASTRRASVGIEGSGCFLLIEKHPAHYLVIVEPKELNGTNGGVQLRISARSRTASGAHEIPQDCAPIVLCDLNAEQVAAFIGSAAIRDKVVDALFVARDQHPCIPDRKTPILSKPPACLRFEELVDD